MRKVFAIAGLLIKEIFRKKDFYVALILSALILFYASRLQFYNVEHIYKYLLEIGLALSFTCSVVLAVALAARQYPSEIQNRTCQVLLAKPLRRSEFVLGKFLGSFLAGGACFFVFYFVFILFASAKTHSLPLVLTFQTFYLFLLNLMVLTAMASGLSYYLTMAANVTITLILYLLINTYGMNLKEFSQAIYYLVPHFEFFDARARFIHGWNPVSAGLILFLTAYAVFYAGFFLFIGWLKFKRQPL